MVVTAKPLKVAHSVVVTPHRAGIYETTLDLAAAERRAGIDARLIDPVNTPKMTSDRGVPIANFDFLNEVDVLINHSGLGGAMAKVDLPIIHMAHGRPHSTFRLEQAGEIAVYSHWRKMMTDHRYKKIVTFWPEYVPYLANVFGEERVTSIPAPVDLRRWTTEGESGYGFNGHKATLNVVCADMWRHDKEPYHVLNAFLLFRRKYPELDVKLHIYAQPKGTAWDVLRSLLKEAGALGESVGIVTGLENVYRAADVMITPHRIATRSVREALACGCSVVMAPGNNYTPYLADPEDLERYTDVIATAIGERNPNRRIANRATAASLFDSGKTAVALIQIINDVIGSGRG